jgi:transposase InsO family protein
LKTLKREEIYANDYVDLEHLRRNIETFIETYYNRCRLHSALAPAGYSLASCSPAELASALPATHRGEHRSC